MCSPLHYTTGLCAILEVDGKYRSWGYWGGLNEWSQRAFYVTKQQGWLQFNDTNTYQLKTASALVG